MSRREREAFLSQVNELSLAGDWEAAEAVIQQMRERRQALPRFASLVNPEIQEVIIRNAEAQYSQTQYQNNQL